MINQPTVYNIRWPYVICLFLALITLLAYAQVGRFNFTNFDDNVYVTENCAVKAGLTAGGIKWSFAISEDKDSTYWHPLTWLSHMLDVELYGLNPGGHHLTNLLLHVLNTLLLFTVFHYMTGAAWRSALVAALFALHPLNVESVAWIAERKNLLSTFWGFLTIGAYALYVKGKGWAGYLLTLFLYLIGLMAKPMLVTLPFMLLLLDYWPLGRIPWGANKIFHAGASNRQFISFPRLVIEKIPFLVFSLAAVWVATNSLHRNTLVIPTDMVPAGLRLSNAVVSYLKYIIKMIWPQNLAVYYPFPSRVPAWEIATAAILLIGISGAAVRQAKKRPYFLVGWLWFLGTLVPVIGLVQTGLWPEIADRWAYVPLVGLFLVMAWGITEVVEKLRFGKEIAAAVGLVLLVGLTTATRMQVRCWRNSVTLFEQAHKVVPDNFIIHSNLGNALARTGRLQEAVVHYTAAVRINPGKAADVYNNMGAAFLVNHRIAEAKDHFARALKIDSRHAGALNNMRKISNLTQK